MFSIRRFAACALPLVLLMIVLTCVGTRSRPTFATSDDSREVLATDTATTGHIAHADLVENSAITRSAMQPGVFFTINDSGNDPILYAIDSTGADRGAWRVTNATNIDWESISVGPCGEAGNPGRIRPGSPGCIYIGETGDNAARYPTRTIYRVLEPAAAQVGYTGATSPVEKLTYTYSDGPHDVEGMYVSPDGTITLITKRPLSDSAGRLRPALVFQIPVSAWGSSAPVMAMLVDSLSAIIPGSLLQRQVTDAALSPDAQYVAIRTYTQLYIFRTDPVTGRIRTQTRPSICEIGFLQERQGEGIAWSHAGIRFVLTTEGSAAPVHMVTCPLPQP